MITCQWYLYVFCKTGAQVIKNKFAIMYTRMWGLCNLDGKNDLLSYIIVKCRAYWEILIKQNCKVIYIHIGLYMNNWNEKS